MNKKLEQIVLRAYRLQIPIGKLCQAAGIAPSTWSRWHNGQSEPTETKVQLLLDELDRLEGEANAAS